MSAGARIGLGWLLPADVGKAVETLRVLVRETGVPELRECVGERLWEWREGRERWLEGHEDIRQLLTQQRLTLPYQCCFLLTDEETTLVLPEPRLGKGSSPKGMLNWKVGHWSIAVWKQFWRDSLSGFRSTRS